MASSSDGSAAGFCAATSAFLVRVRRVGAFFAGAAAVSTPTVAPALLAEPAGAVSALPIFAEAAFVFPAEPASLLSARVAALFAGLVTAELARRDRVAFALAGAAWTASVFPSVGCSFSIVGVTFAPNRCPHIGRQQRQMCQHPQALTEVD